MTPRPGRVARVLDNPGAGDEAYRGTEAFHAKCVELRGLLASVGALHPGGGAS